jgi:phospholipase C
MRPTRRDALKGIGVTLGAVAVAGCGGEESPAGTSDSADPDAAEDGRDAASPEVMLAGIDTFVVLMMENRSFDHYLGALRLVEGRDDVDGLTGSESNPAPSGPAVLVHRLDDFTPDDPAHDWDACHGQWNLGANDGFVMEHAGASQADVMGYHVREDLGDLRVRRRQRHLRSLARVGDGPTWPNRFYLHGASSNGIQSNLPAFGFRSIFDASTTPG